MARQPSFLRVLVVDDEPLICWSVAEILRECGDIVMKAGTGAAAIRAVSSEPDSIDVILLDYQLPDVRHLNLLSTLRHLSPDSRVIVMTAYYTPELARAALALGAVTVISKPIDIHEVPALVHGGIQPAWSPA